MSKDRASVDEELDAQLERMREMLKLLAPDGGSAGVLGAPGSRMSPERPSTVRTAQRVERKQ